MLQDGVLFVIFLMTDPAYNACKDPGTPAYGIPLQAQGFTVRVIIQTFAKKAPVMHAVIFFFFFFFRWGVRFSLDAEKITISWVPPPERAWKI